MDTTTHMCYQIRVQGHLDPAWWVWFDGMAIRHTADSTTSVEGPVVDHATLYGLIGKARDLGLTLLSVARNEPAEGAYT